MDGDCSEHARVVEGLQARTRLGESEGPGRGRLNVAEFASSLVRGTVDFLDEDVPVGYLRALERTDQAEYRPLAELVARAVKDSLDGFLLPALAGPLQLLPLSALMRKGVTALALRRAAEKGRLQAQRRATGWYSTKAWVDRYARSRRGPAAKTRGA